MDNAKWTNCDIVTKLGHAANDSCWMDVHSMSLKLVYGGLNVAC
jgi:hypothetical protein